MPKKILKLLEKYPAVSVKQLASMAGTSEAKTKKIISGLKAKGILRGVKAVIDWEKAGEQKCYALVDVKVSPARNVGFDDIAERIYRFPEVRFVYLVSGLYDLSIMVEGKTMKDISSFVSGKLAPLDRVQSTITHFVMKKYKEEGEVFEEKTDRRMPVTP